MALSRARPLRRGPVTLRAVEHGSPRPPSVAFAVGRPVGGAVLRNRLRRRLRAAVRTAAADLRPGVAYLVGASREAADLDFAELSRLVRSLVREVPAGRRVVTG